jgi:hypothetical protein
MMRRTIRFTMSAALVAAMAGLAACNTTPPPAAAPPPLGPPDAFGFVSREGQVEFSAPSGNIGCVFTPAGGTSFYQPAGGGPELSCDRVAPTYVRVIMEPAGPPLRFPNPGDQGCCGATNILGYGKTWSAGPFSCTSSTRGMSCMRADGRGFKLSKSDVALR